MSRTRVIALATAALFAVPALTGCSSFTEPWNDAPIEKKYDDPAEVYSMPDGFANVATKCDRHGNRIYTTRGAESGGGKAVAVVPQDRSCGTDGAR
ncbi:hypothetical protein [Streptomyces sp. NPDC059761]|uniref:hypothetical protein n=1 Tax=Streptomyces sp. NPDC059761 TaxID=3346937 RepID=UPI00365220F0